MHSIIYTIKNCVIIDEKLGNRDIAQLGRAPALGAGGRRFKSYYPDS